jgi:hypothetical protein
MTMRSSSRIPLSALRAVALIAVAAFVPALAAQKPDSAAKDTTKSKPLGFLTDTVVRYGLVPHRFGIKVGGFLPSVSTGARFSSPNFPGTDINLENKLGLSKQTQDLDIEGTWRFANRQLLTLDFFEFNRSGSRSITDTIKFDSINFTGSLHANAGLQYYGITYRYYIWRESRWEIGAGLGIDALKLSAGLAFRVAASGGGGGFADSAAKSGGFTAPAPMIGLYGDWEFVPRFFLRGQLQYLYINNVATYGGHVSDDKLAVEWFPLHNYGLGAMYHYIDLSITKTFKTSAELNLNYAIQGPAFYLTAAF